MNERKPLPEYDNLYKDGLREVSRWSLSKSVAIATLGTLGVSVWALSSHGLGWEAVTVSGIAAAFGAGIVLATWRHDAEDRKDPPDKAVESGT